MKTQSTVSAVARGETNPDRMTEMHNKVSVMRNSSNSRIPAVSSAAANHSARFVVALFLTSAS
jgi:hypothetical protein